MVFSRRKVLADFSSFSVNSLAPFTRKRWQGYDDTNRPPPPFPRPSRDDTLSFQLPSPGGRHVTKTPCRHCARALRTSFSERDLWSRRKQTTKRAPYRIILIFPPCTGLDNIRNCWLHLWGLVADCRFGSQFVLTFRFHIHLRQQEYRNDDVGKTKTDFWVWPENLFNNMFVHFYVYMELEVVKKCQIV